VLCVETDIFQLLRANGLEGAKTDVEGNGFNLNPLCFELVEDFRCEMEPSSRGGSASNFMGEDGLIAVAVFEVVVPMNVRRERHVSYFVEDGVEVQGRRETQGAFPELCRCQDFSFEEGLGLIRGMKEKALTGLDLAAGADEGGPVAGGKLLREKDFDAARGVRRAGLRLLATGAGCVEPGGKNAAVVEDQQIAGVQDLGKIAKKIVVVAARGAVENQHPAAAANGRWRLGDQLFGEVEMEVGYSHSMSF